MKTLNQLIEEEIEKFDDDFFVATNGRNDVRKDKIRQSLTNIAKEITNVSENDMGLLKKIHNMELDAISCKSLNDFVIWSDNRKAQEYKIEDIKLQEQEEKCRRNEYEEERIHNKLEKDNIF